MTHPLSTQLMDAVRRDVAALPPTAVPLAGALLSVETALPAVLRTWILTELDRRVPLDVVTPAAEAVMRIREFGRLAQMDFAIHEIQAQYALLEALNLVDSMYAAIDFMSQLAQHLETAAAPPPVPRPPRQESMP